MRRRLWAVLIALAIGAGGVGCGEKEEPEPDPQVPSVPTGADDVVLQSFTGGGYVPPIDTLRTYPEVVLYGNGRLLTAPLEDRGAALPELAERHLSDEEIGTVLGAAVDAGLAESGVDYGFPEVTDLPTTTVVFQTGEDRFESSAYALGFDGSDDELTDEQAEARESLDLFIGELANPDSELGASLPAAGPFESDSWIVSSIASSAQRGPTVEWPLAADRFASKTHPQTCTVVSGGDLEAFERAARKASRGALWESGGTSAEVAIRPAIGLEDRCPDEGRLFVGTDGEA